MADLLLDREAKVTYGSLVIGGAAAGTSYRPWGAFDLNLSYPSGSFSMRVLVTGETEAEFVTNETALKAAFRIPHQSLVVELGSATRYSFDPAAKTGLNTQPQCKIANDETQTARSAVYEVSVQFGLPADWASDDGLLESSINVTQPGGQGKRFLEIGGTITAIPTGPVAARAQYLARISGYESTVQTLVGGSWKLRGTGKAQHDKENNVLRFARRYEEEIYGDFVAILSDAQYTDQQLDIDVEVSDTTPVTGHEDATKPKDALLQFSCYVDKGTSTDLLAEWSNTIRPHLLSQLGAALGSFIILSDHPRYSAATNRVSATIVARSYAGVSISQLQVLVDDDRDEGVELVPLLDGRDYSYRRYLWPKTWIRTITREGARTVGGSRNANPSPLFLLDGGDDGDSPLTPIVVPEGFQLMREGRRGFSYREGIPGSDQELEHFVESVRLQRADVA